MHIRFAYFALLLLLISCSTMVPGEIPEPTPKPNESFEITLMPVDDDVTSMVNPYVRRNDQRQFVFSTGQSGYITVLARSLATISSVDIKDIELTSLYYPDIGSSSTGTYTDADKTATISITHKGEYHLEVTIEW